MRSQHYGIESSLSFENKNHHQSRQSTTEQQNVFRRRQVQQPRPSTISTEIGEESEYERNAGKASAGIINYSSSFSGISTMISPTSSSLGQSTIHLPQHSSAYQYQNIRGEQQPAHSLVSPSSTAIGQQQQQQLQQQQHLEHHQQQHQQQQQQYLQQQQQQQLRPHPPSPLILDPSSQNVPLAAASTRLNNSNSSRGESNNRTSLVGRIFGRKDPSSNSSTMIEEGRGRPGGERPVVFSEQDTAAALARTAPRAGFLQKLGSNIPEFKRRFFVLQPTTLLYYFLSPHDVEPRGCIDLEGANIREYQQLPDGRFRFEVVLSGGDGSQQQNKTIVLEARSKDVGEEWMSSMKVERLSHTKHQLWEHQQLEQEYKAKIADMERQIQDYRHVEHDRDGALEDAAQWREKFEQLDNAMRLLTQQMRKPMIIPTTTTTQPEIHLQQKEGKEAYHDNNEENKSSEDKPTLILTSKKQEEEEKKEEDDENITEVASTIDEKQSTPRHSNGENDSAKQSNIEEENPSSSYNDTLSKNENDHNDDGDDNEIKSPPRTAALLDSTMLDDDDDDENKEISIDDILPPEGSLYFSALSNACQQLRENIRLASVEASTAVEDLTEANGKVDFLDKRMAKAEKHLCKLWEENCDVRKQLKQCKKEKKVLVREIKSLHATAAAETRNSSLTATATATADTSFQGEAQGTQTDDSTFLEEEKLINELEEHVMSSIKLHEQLLCSTNNTNGGRRSPWSALKLNGNTENDDGTNVDAQQQSSLLSDVLSNDQPTSHNVVDDKDHTAVYRDDQVTTNKLDSDIDALTNDEVSSIDKSVKQMSSIASLMDMDDDSEDDDESNADDDSTAPSLAPSFVSLLHTNTIAKDNNTRQSPTPVGETTTGPLVKESPANTNGGENDDNADDDKSEEQERQNPLLELDQEEASIAASSLCTEESFKPTVTDNGTATTRLDCPLADVTKTHESSNTDVDEDGQVYHLTFYSRKIGLQFQKVPAPAMSNGVLTQAMTADLAGTRGDEEKTASELRRIAEISDLASSSQSSSIQPPSKEASVCPVVSPVDAVLVCGFQGFDDSTHQTRPKLGARLVAFDGMSVEVGRWTFDAIRKAIQARARPMTLSFRNDFLTTKQRSILTKAVGDVDPSLLQPSAPIRLVQPTTPRIANYVSRVPDSVSTLHSTESHNNNYFQPIEDDAYSTSVAGSSIASGSDYNNRNPTQLSSLRRKANTPPPHERYYSFSDAGSSSVVSATFGPLMANLMSGLSQKRRDSSGGGSGSGSSSIQESEGGSTGPQYLRHSTSGSLDNNAQHRHFQASLL